MKPKSMKYAILRYIHSIQQHAILTSLIERELEHAAECFVRFVHYCHLRLETTLVRMCRLRPSADSLLRTLQPPVHISPTLTARIPRRRHHPYRILLLLLPQQHLALSHKPIHILRASFQRQKSSTPLHHPQLRPELRVCAVERAYEPLLHKTP